MDTDNWINPGTTTTPTRSWTQRVPYVASVLLALSTLFVGRYADQQKQAADTATYQTDDLRWQLKMLRDQSAPYVAPIGPIGFEKTWMTREQRADFLWDHDHILTFYPHYVVESDAFGWVGIHNTSTTTLVIRLSVPTSQKGFSFIGSDGDPKRSRVYPAYSLECTLRPGERQEAWFQTPPNTDPEVTVAAAHVGPWYVVTPVPEKGASAPGARALEP